MRNNFYINFLSLQKRITRRFL
jgi:hypothetical protein